MVGGELVGLRAALLLGDEIVVRDVAPAALDGLVADQSVDERRKQMPGHVVVQPRAPDGADRTGVFKFAGGLYGPVEAVEKGLDAPAT